MVLTRTMDPKVGKKRREAGGVCRKRKKFKGKTDSKKGGPEKELRRSGGVPCPLFGEEVFWGGEKKRVSRV